MIGARVEHRGEDRAQSGFLAVAGPALLALGIGWLIFSLAIPQLDFRTARSLSVLLGLLLFAAAVSELATAATADRDWRPTHGLLAFLSIAGGIVALAWPGPTITVVSRILAWYLLFKGIHDIATAFAGRSAAPRGAAFGTDAGNLSGRSPWWAPLAVGAFEIGVAFWAVSYPHQSRGLMLLWLGLAALATGLTRITSAFWSRAAAEAEAEFVPPTGYGARAAGEAGRAGAETRVRPPAG
jgi:uncharacterized membrane protein HdeD (DUF308 family)